MQDTKEKILLAALKLFAQDGYKAVSVSQIAGALGMTKGALYKHYKNKRDIFAHIVAHMEAQDAQEASEHQVPEGTLAEDTAAYAATPFSHILTYSQSMFHYWTHDPFAAPFRKLLTLEQYLGRGDGAAVSAIFVRRAAGLSERSVRQPGIRPTSRAGADLLRPHVLPLQRLRWPGRHPPASAAAERPLGQDVGGDGWGGLTLKTDIEIIQIEVICDEALHCRVRNRLTNQPHRLEGFL